MTEKTVYARFFGVKRDLTERELAYYTELDFEHHVALVATVMWEGTERIVGVGRYVESEDESPDRTAEIALTVDDAFQNQGIGTLLFRQITLMAQDSGIARMKAEVLLDNHRMLAILKHSGFNLTSTRRNEALHIEFSLESS